MTMRNFLLSFQKSSNIFIFAVGVVIFSMYIVGVNKVPFHPDEATHIYMAHDFEEFLKNPFRLAYDPENDDPTRQRYRLIDAPLNHYLIGFGLCFEQSALEN